MTNDIWEPFFDLMEKTLLADDLIGLVVPTLNVLCSVWGAKPELCE